MKKLISLFYLLILTSVLFAHDDLLSYAKVLFDDGKFSSSQSILSNLSSGSDVTAEILYLNAKCSKELFLSDAVLLYEKLEDEFPFHQFKDEVNEDLALIYYRQKKYYEAISYLQKINTTSNNLKFKLAYSYFSVDSLNMAKLYFSEIMQLDSKFAAASQYYYAFISYRFGLYKSALYDFKKLLNDEKFGDIVPYYITQIYFFNKEYKKLILFAKPLYSKVIASRKAEINRLLADAYYRTNDFQNAIGHYEECLIDKSQQSSLIYYLLGHSYFKSENFDAAIYNLERVSNASDSIMQYSYYFLGASYINEKHYNYALQAFKKSANYNYNKELQEDASYNYSKLSYQLELPFENTLQTLTNYLTNYDHPINSAIINTLMVEMLQSSSQYSEAFNVLREISSPNVDQQETLQKLAFFLGVKEFNKKNFVDAIDYFDSSIKYDLNHIYSYLSRFWMADCYFHLGNYKNAIKGYTNLSFISSLNLSYYDDLMKYNLAYSYFKESDFLNAVKLFRSYQKVTVDSMKLNDTYLRIADGYFMLSNFDLSAKYYSKAIDLNLFDIDYALYQKSISLGLIGKNIEKIKLLKKIVLDFSSSSYYDNSLYDLARHYKNLFKYKLANKYYDDLIISSDNENFIAEAYLSKAIINFNNSNTEVAINHFLYVINNYRHTKFFKQALLGLQSAYSSIAEIDKYLEIIQSLKDVSITKSEQDSLSYNAAFMKFSEADYYVAKNSFDKYMASFTSGIFLNDATYYNAISSIKIGDTLSAVANYKKIIDNTSANYKEDALLFMARYSFIVSDYVESNMYYTKLLNYASSNSVKREAVIRLMSGNEDLDKSLALKYAKQVILHEKIDDWLLSKAYIIIARSEFDSGNYAKSKSTFEIVTSLSDYDEGAEAKYFLAYLTYLDDNFLQAEEIIFALSENYSSDHFIAKAFILLSDIYVAQDNLFQAQATLQSIIDHHDDKKLVIIARQKWESILEMQEVVLVPKVDEASYIEILEDDLEYVVEEINEDYIVPLPDSTIVDVDSLEIINKNILEYEFE